MNRLLAGIRVLDLSRLVPGPFCSLHLAQLGAEVIKLEDPAGGDPTRHLAPALFAQLNRGKRSLALDLREPAGRRRLHELVTGADVLLESFRPGVMARYGCDYTSLRAYNPRLVYAALTGYGQTGPWAPRAGHDLNFQASSGLLAAARAGTGTENAAPRPGRLPLTDLAGGLSCALGIVAALFGARASGQGCFLDAALLDSALALQPTALAGLAADGFADTEDRLAGALPNYDTYRCADGRDLALGALELKFWRNFCAAVGRADLAQTLPQPGAAGEPVRLQLRELFASRSREHWMAVLEDADACVSAVLEFDEALKTEQIRGRGLIGAAGADAAFPIRFTNAATPEPGPAPELDEAAPRDGSRFG
jgi:Predicted acyl-CoA transferases/carnitine dehydratase